MTQMYFFRMILITSVVSLGLAMCFQNCGAVKFSDMTSASSNTITDEPSAPLSLPTSPLPNEAPGKLEAGHFDLDTSHLVYQLGRGTTDFHVHDYSTQYNTSEADFFYLLHERLENVSELVSPTQRFIIIIANSQLSKGGTIDINGTQHKVTDYQNSTDDLLSKNQLPQVYELSGPNTAGDQLLKGLKVNFPKDVIVQGGLIGTETGCVRRNDAGKNGEYRNGALVVQILDAAKAKIDPVLKVATPDGGLLWEATLFYHWNGGCY